MNFFHALTLLLVVLKAVGLFHYSWWIVLAPSMISIGIGLLVLLFISLASIIIAVKS